MNALRSGSIFLLRTIKKSSWINIYFNINPRGYIAPFRVYTELITVSRELYRYKTHSVITRYISVTYIILAHWFSVANMLPIHYNCGEITLQSLFWKYDLSKNNYHSFPHHSILLTFYILNHQSRNFYGMYNHMQMSQKVQHYMMLYQKY